jgi:hypothetical protein
MILSRAAFDLDPGDVTPSIRGRKQGVTEKINEFSLYAYCGSYCGACSIAKYGETGRADGFSACLASVPKEELLCGGCKSETVYAGCSTGTLRRCASERGVAHCVDCADYPCKMCRAWQSVAKFLPHAHEAPSSLETIKRDGVDSWLAAQKKRRSRPDCGLPFSWYAPKCRQCRP